MSKRKNYFCDCIRNKDKTYWEGSHSSKSKQNLKRKIVKVIKDLNDSVLHDNLWRGRFYITCDSIQYTNYSDGSGTYGWVYLTFCDLATGQVSQVMFNDFDFTMFNGYKVWERLNSLQPLNMIAMFGAIRISMSMPIRPCIVPFKEN